MINIESIKQNLGSKHTLPEAPEQNPIFFRGHRMMGARNDHLLTPLGGSDEFGQPGLGLVDIDLSHDGFSVS